MADVVTFTAPCPDRHPGAHWTQRQSPTLTSVTPEHFTIACGPCGTAPRPDPPTPAHAPVPLHPLGYRFIHAAVAVAKAVVA